MRYGRSRSFVYDAWTAAPSLFPCGPGTVEGTAAPDPHPSAPSRQQPGGGQDLRAAGSGPPPTMPEAGEPTAGPTAPNRGARRRRPPRWTGAYRAANSRGNGEQTIPTNGQNPPSVRTWQNTHTLIEAGTSR